MNLSSHDGLTSIKLLSRKKTEPPILPAGFEVNSASICDVNPAARSMDPSIRPMFPGVHIIGDAITVSLPGGDNLLLHTAIRLIQPGQVLVVSAGEPKDWFGCFGELMQSATKVMGAAGVVIDGYVRDPIELADGILPVFARGVSPKGCDKAGGGEINGRLSCGGVDVNPGDIIIADDGGIVVLEPDHFKKSVDEANRKLNKEKQRKTEILAGNVSPSFLENTLREIGLAELLHRPEWK